MGFERHLQDEIMDSPDLDERRHLIALDALQRINYFSGTVGQVWSDIQPTVVRYHDRRITLLDLACGGGDVALGLEAEGRKQGFDVQVVGSDASPVAIRRARRQAQQLGSKARFSCLDVLQDPLPTGADIVFSTLFLHHLSEDQAVNFLRRMAAAASRLVVVLDLERTRQGYLLAYAGVRLLTTSDVARFDGPASVRAAFTREEAQALARSAGLDMVVRGCWLQRYSLTWAKS